MDTLTRLFSSGPLVKIMRLFILNANTPFENKDIISRCKVSSSALRTEMAILNGVKFIQKKSFFKEVPARSKTGKPKKKRVSGWVLNEDFQYLDALKSLLVDSEMVEEKSIMNRFKGAGNIKLLLVSGIFIKEDDGRVDLLIVGDKLKKGSLDKSLKLMESEVGKELNYSVMETSEFNYRLGLYDKFVRDILDKPHRRIIDKLGVGKKN